VIKCFACKVYYPPFPAERLAMYDGHMGRVCENCWTQYKNAKFRYDLKKLQDAEAIRIKFLKASR